ncbi:MAG: GNAT family N-acetyltransferase [Oscillospiraceae bacterium]|nr:GNAT family N-acetyltransferase [Oscillospiraceae bacterium]
MRLTATTDFERVKAAYLDVIENTPDFAKDVRWIYGLHPSDAIIRSYIENGEMYVWQEDGEIAAVAAVAMRQSEDYEIVSWAEPLENDEVATLHLLAVRPKYQGRSLAGRILQEALEIAKRHGKKALRLDTLTSNLRAKHIYESAGFTYRGKYRNYAANLGMVDFLYYEKQL